MVAKHKNTQLSESKNHLVSSNDAVSGHVKKNNDKREPGGQRHDVARKKKKKVIAKTRRVVTKRKKKPLVARTTRIHRTKPKEPIVLVQSSVRRFLAKVRYKRMKLAKESGVMIAMSGTTQGKSGRYQDFDGQVYFFAVTADGAWWQVVSREKWNACKETTLDDTHVLVPANGTALGSDGDYFAYDPTLDRAKQSEQPRRWLCDGQGIWKTDVVKKRSFFPSNIFKRSR